jgi:hypothetical protein
VPQRLNPISLKTDLEKLIITANSTEPLLAQRLKDLMSWIGKKKDGFLMSKPYVLDLLTELTLDSELWLSLKRMTPDEKQKFYNQEEITSAEQYWYDFLFPQWLHERDPKLPIWKQEMMAGNFHQNDETLINNLSQSIEAYGGSCMWRYILDLSMATDLAVVGSLNIPLCVQLTTSTSDSKRINWEEVLRHWGIERGLFVRFNPRSLDTDALAKGILKKGDILPSHCYDQLISN